MEEKWIEIREIIDDPEKADAVIAILQQVEQRKKQQRRERQAEGIAAAKERGVQFGRPPVQMPKRFPQVYESCKQGLISGKLAADILGVSIKSYRKLAAQYEQAEGGFPCRNASGRKIT